MEDAHISISPLSDKRSSLFAVFDGHGGINFTNNYRGRSRNICLKTFYRIIVS
jgi:serine/threonine protein phosphatase PrpC